MIVDNDTASDARRRLLCGAHMLMSLLDGRLVAHKDRPHWRKSGLCENIKWLGGVYDESVELRVAATHELHRAFETWDRWSMDHSYPVPYCGVEFDAVSAYKQQDDMYEGDYGELRIDLLRHLIAHWENME